MAEYRVSENPDDVSNWYSDNLTACGWKQDGSWNSSAGVFTDGIVFIARANRHLQVQVGFGTAMNGDTLIGYGVLDETLPPRPIASYLHGPFSRVNIAYRLSPSAPSAQTAHIIHLSITDPATIHRLVRRINSLTDILAGFRSGPSGGGDGPAWLTFVRPDGRHIGVFDTVLGLQVQHTRTLFDGNRVWPLISRLVKIALQRHSVEQASPVNAYHRSRSGGGQLSRAGMGPARYTESQRASAGYSSSTGDSPNTAAWIAALWLDESW